MDYGEMQKAAGRYREYAEALFGDGRANMDDHFLEVAEVQAQLAIAASQIALAFEARLARMDQIEMGGRR